VLEILNQEGHDKSSCSTNGVTRIANSFSLVNLIGRVFLEELEVDGRKK
jgi:hypothetical protein